MQADPDLPDFNLLSPELSRDFRGPARLAAAQACTASGRSARNLEEKLDLARWAAEQLREIPGIEILAEPQLSIVAFRLRAARGLRGAELDRLNRDAPGARSTPASAST